MRNSFNLSEISFDSPRGLGSRGSKTFGAEPLRKRRRISGDPKALRASFDSSSHKSSQITF